jgi:hypothetical protein
MGEWLIFISFLRRPVVMTVSLENTVHLRPLVGTNSIRAHPRHG